MLMENYMKKKIVAMRKVAVKGIQLDQENLTAPRKENKKIRKKIKMKTKIGRWEEGKNEKRKKKKWRERPDRKQHN